MSLLRIQVSDDLDETRLLSSELLALIMSDGVQTAFDLLGAAKFCGEIDAKARGRKPFVTKKGHLGLELDHVEPGDAVAVLIGYQVPFVLRKSVGGRYKIVGEAYVDGIMDGEAVVGKEFVGVLELIRDAVERTCIVSYHRILWVNTKVGLKRLQESAALEIVLEA